MQPQSFRRARMPSRGSHAPLVSSPGTMHCPHRSIWAGHSGATGADTTAGAASKQTLSSIALQSTAGQWMHCVKQLGQRLPLIAASSDCRAMHGARLRPTGRGGSGAHRDPERLHRPWHPRHEGHGMNPSGERGAPSDSRFVQQSRIYPSPFSIAAIRDFNCADINTSVAALAASLASSRSTRSPCPIRSAAAMTWVTASSISSGLCS